MAGNKDKLFIINRSFWPVYPVIGEALLRFAEQEATRRKVGVILQDHAGIREQLREHGRGEGVSFYPVKAWSVSGSSIIRRVMDAVFFMCWVLVVLLWQRPSRIYVSTDPPVLVPFIVMLYCKLFRASYIYHLQDIHPEAANVVMPVSPWLFRFFRGLDACTMRHAGLLITITEEMAQEIRQRSQTKTRVMVVPNPSVAFEGIEIPNKTSGFTFCGNAGRLQRIPLLLEAITEYARKGGTLPFVFAGSGVYAKDLERLAVKCPNVTYKGLISPTEAAELNARYEWALLPIEDEVTRYAFPSKSSSYVYSGAYVAAVCGKQTAVAQWVARHRLGVVIEPELSALVQFFFDVEQQVIDKKSFDIEREALKASLSFEVFVSRLTNCLGDVGQPS